MSDTGQVGLSANAGARLDRLPISSFHWRILALIAGGLFFDAFDTYMAGGVLGSLVKDGTSNVDLNAAFISASTGGMAIGAAASGLIGDRLGRRYAYQTNLAIFGLAALASTFAPSMNWLIALRFIQGIGLGGEIVIGYAMLSEFVPPAVRGRWSAALALAANGALFVSTLFTYLIIPSFGWRPMFAIAGVGALVVLYLRKAMPESPRWLESVGRHADAERVLAEIEREVSLKHTLPAVLETVRPPEVDVRLNTFFKQPVLSRIVVGTVVCVVIGMALYGFVAWVPTFLVKRGYNIIASLGFSTLMSLGAPLGAILALYLSDRIGRKPAMIGSAALAIVFAAIYASVHDVAIFTIAGFVLFTLIYFLLAVGQATYVAELFDTKYRLRGAGICSTIARVTAIFTPFAVVAAFNYAGLSGVIGLLCAGFVVLIFVVAIFGIETNQRRLEEIAASASGENVLDSAIDRSKSDAIIGAR
jgi:putative MFS transporter